MLYDKKMFLIKIVQVKRNKEVENKQQKKSRKIRERKKWGKMKNKKNNVSMKFVKVTMKRKGLYNLSNLERRF